MRCDVNNPDRYYYAGAVPSSSTTSSERPHSTGAVGRGLRVLGRGYAVF